MKLKKVIEKVRQAAQSSPATKRSCDVLDCAGIDSAVVINTGTIPSLHSNSVETENQMSATASTSSVNASSSSQDGFHFTGDCLFERVLFLLLFNFFIYIPRR